MKFVFPAVVPRYEESHGSEDVGLWATGPLAFMFHRTHEQSYVGHVMAFSLCIGHYKGHPLCSKTNEFTSKDHVVPVIMALTIIGVVVLILVVIWKKTRKTPYGRSGSQDPETMT